MTVRDFAALSKPILVTDNALLQQLCQHWQRNSVLALDTEFIRISTFFPKLGLLQVCDGQGSYLLDPLRLTQWDAFIELLTDNRIVKVLHSCSEDLVVLQRFFKVVPTPVFDTQKAAAYLNLGFSLSYQNLVKALLQIDVPKGETRSDWLRRPLSQEQLLYAALDVAYLPDVYQQLLGSLQDAGRLQWLQEDCAQMCQLSGGLEEEDKWEDYYLTMGAAWRLDSEQLGALRELCHWREIEARTRDKPRSWIARDTDLIAIASAMPENQQALRSIDELPDSLLRADSKILLDKVRSGAASPADTGQFEQPLSQEQRKTLKRCQSAVRQLASAMQLAEELLARKKLLIHLLLNYKGDDQLCWPAEVPLWRTQALEKALLQALSKQPTEE